MGRKGMKGFLKGVAHQPAEAESTEDGQLVSPPASASKPGPTVQTADKTPASAAAPAQTSEQTEAGQDDDDTTPPAGEETRGQMLQRHKREMMAHKKAMSKLGKSKKDEVARLTAEIQQRHEQELKSLEQAVEAGDEDLAADAEVTNSVANLQISQDTTSKKPSKAQKRKEKLKQQEAEREARIAAEQEAAGPSNRQLEEERLAALLRPHQLQIREIRADGHCMYRAVQDQLEQAHPPSPAPDYLELRRLAADHIRSHPDDYLPFLMDEDGGEGEPLERLQAYCQELQSTACWGGQMELRALAEAVKKHIRVYAVGMPEVNMGEEYQAEGTLKVCYLQHAFGLGEHYNSVEPLTEGEEQELQPDSEGE